jgi:ascorbate-specific PTS system EIIC-type component UlaA
MVVRFKFSSVKDSRWSELILRFFLGGLATVVAGMAGNVWGPVVGGLFLAMPAIFFASATMIEKHERERKEEKGMKGGKRGKNAAALDAAGAGVGAAGLAAFGVVVWVLAQYTAAGSLVFGTIVWFAVSALLWRARSYARVIGTRRHGAPFSPGGT